MIPFIDEKKNAPICLRFLCVCASVEDVSRRILLTVITWGLGGDTETWKVFIRMAAYTRHVFLQMKKKVSLLEDKL